jgi:hypothetical protein
LRKLVIVLGALILVGWGAWRLHRHPRVQDLFYGTARAPAPRSVWKIQTQDRPAAAGVASIAKPTVVAAQRRNANASPKEEEKQENVSDEMAASLAPGSNSAANDVVTRVILQVLATRKLVSGVAISTSDTVLIVNGIVDSEEKRQQILAIVEKARQARQVDSQNLIVEPKK